MNRRSPIFARNCTFVESLTTRTAKGWCGLALHTFQVPRFKFHFPPNLKALSVLSYQAAAADVIQQYNGHIAQYLGDGLLVYFGYPQAHEREAHRAIHTGLGIVEAMATLNRRLQSEYGVELAVRLGIHTGPVVVGQMGGGGRHEQLALGETPNIAARLEGLAAP